MVGEMSVRGNVLVGKCPVGEVSGRQTVLQSLHSPGDSSVFLEQIYLLFYKGHCYLLEKFN